MREEIRVPPIKRILHEDNFPPDSVYDIRHDIFGHELMVGDTVAFNPPVYKGIVTGSILKFSKKKVTVSYVPHGKQYTVKCSIFSSELVKEVV